MTGDRPAVIGLLIYLIVATSPTLLFWLVLRLVPAAVSAIADRRNRRHQQPGPCLESAVADLRRLRRELRCCRPANQVRNLALNAAYDHSLLDVCRLVGVDAPLRDAPEADRDFARLLTEAVLEDAGVALDPPPGGTTAA